MERKNSHFVEGHPAQKTYHAAVEPVEETVYGDYTHYLLNIGEYSQGTQHRVLGKMTIESETIDTDWGNSGYWGILENGTGTSKAYDVLFLDDGRMLVSYGYIQIDEGSDDYTLVSMVNSDGTTDTSWGTNGHYKQDYEVKTNYFVKILEDNDGNFHLLGSTSSSSGYTYIKLDSDGGYITGLKKSETGSTVFWDACWADEEKTRIIGGGTKLVAINPSTGTVDTDWGTNGFYTLSWFPYNVIRMSDGGFVLYSNEEEQFRKVKSDGSGLDTTWGTEGVIATGYDYFGLAGLNKIVCDSDDNIFVVVKKDVDGVANCIFTRIDETGTIIDTHNIVTNAASYNTIGLIGDNLYFHSGLTKDIEIWTKDFEYVSGWDLPLTGINISYIYWIRPDESTRTVVTAATEGNDEYWTSVAESYDHLEGETVSILADGVVMPDQVVTDGVIDETDFADATDVHIGLKYSAKVQPMCPVAYDQLGNDYGRTITVKNMGLSVHNTDDIKIGVSDSDKKDVDFSDPQFKNKCDKDGLFSGSVSISVPDGHSVNCPLFVETDSPLPATIRAFVPQVNITR